MRFELTKDFIEKVRHAVQTDDKEWIILNVFELHFADVAEVLDRLNNYEAKYIYFLLDEDKQADVLMELDEDVRERFLASLSSKEIADQLENLDSDDAVDILGDLSDEQVKEVISQMEDFEAVEDIVDLLNYDEDTAGGLMQKELIKARVDWPVDRCLVELRKQAEDVEKVYTIYVTDSNQKLVGVLSLKSILFAKPKTPVSDLYKAKNVISVLTTTSKEEVARIMDKYDLVAIPVIDLQGKLVGRITIDDVVDIIKEEADKDFQLASGISDKIEENSSIWHISRARLLWLLIGMLGGTFSAQVISGFESSISNVPALAFFIPLITAMGGNVGVQSSAIVVQALAKGGSFNTPILTKLAKELTVGLLNGVLCSIVVLMISTYFADVKVGITVSISLLTVMVFAAVMGSLIPLVMNKYKIDPALATGPFVTTLNDVVGLFIYFTVGLLLFNF